MSDDCPRCGGTGQIVIASVGATMVCTCSWGPEDEFAETPRAERENSAEPDWQTGKDEDEHE